MATSDSVLTVNAVHVTDQAHEWIPTRRSLLTRLKRWDDQEGWQDFFNTYWRLIYGTALKAGLTDAEAQDVVQETVIAVAKKMPGFHYDPAHGSFKAWLLKLTGWRIADQFRRRQRQRVLDATDEALPDALEAVPDPAAEARLAAVWEEEWQNSLIEAALDRLRTRISPRQIQIFQLHVLRGWETPKVAAALGVTRAAVYLAKHRVAALLRKEVGRLRADPQQMLNG